MLKYELETSKVELNWFLQSLQSSYFQQVIIHKICMLWKIHIHI